MRLCSHCLHLDVCRYVHDTELWSLIEGIVDRVMEFFDSDEDEVKNAFWDGMGLLFGEKCKEAAWECHFCEKTFHGRPHAWVDPGESDDDGRAPPFPICEGCAQKHHADIDWEDHP